MEESKVINLYWKMKSQINWKKVDPGYKIYRQEK